MGLLDLFKGKYVDPTYPGVHVRGNVITTTLDAVVRWGRKSSMWPMPFGTACCAIEFMAFSASRYDVARFGAEVLRFSPRQADLMFVAGTIVEKEAPVLKTIYDQMPEPKWVISMGVCASTGGFYRAYHVMQGIDEIIPVDIYVPGCPPAPESLLAAIMKLQDRIQAGVQTKNPQRALKLGANGEGVFDRRVRAKAWAREDAERAERSLPPRGVLAIGPVRPDPEEQQHE
jgi:NADH-quinone oxidoreductase subunit B